MEILLQQISVRDLAKGYTYSDLINLVSLNPAKNLHLDKDYGSISPNKKANFAVLDKDFHVLMTIVNGKVVYRKG